MTRMTRLRGWLHRALATATAVGALGLFHGTAAAGEIQFYSSIPRNISDALVKSFEAANPDVKVNLFQAGTEVVLEKIELEVKSSGRTSADVMWIQEPAAMARYGKRKLLEPYRPAGADAIPAVFKDKDDFFTGTAVTFLVLMYNSDLVSKEQAPKSWKDLGDARFANQVILANPRVSGTGAALASAMVQLYGWSFWEKVAAAKPVLAAGHPAMISTVIAGERRVAPMQDLSLVEAMKKGQPVSFTVPSEGALGVGCYAGISRTARNMPDAKRFVDFLASNAAAQVLTGVGMYHTSAKAAPPAGWPRIADIKLLPFDWDKHDALKPELKSKFSDLMER
jgi:iron(III) transport system substrate-binding protein